MKWLFLVLHVQTRNSRERVAVWRLTKKVGALLYRNSVYVLPYSKERLEDFQWLCQEIRDLKGEGSVFVSEASSPAEDRKLRELFEAAREKEYSSLLRVAGQVNARLRRPAGQPHLTDTQIRKLRREYQQLHDTFAQLQRIEFAPRKLATRVSDVLQQIGRHLVSAGSITAGAPVARYSRKDFAGKTWATREHIHIDRLCSSWLIRRFIDAKAKLVFAPEARLPQNAILYDVYGAEFSHHGDHCTFETLIKAFNLRDRALESIAQIVHDIDLKDQKFGRPEAAGLDAVVRSLSESLDDDHRVVEIGSILLDALYKHFPAGREK